MTGQQHRRQFLQGSLATGAVLTLGGLRQGAVSQAAPASGERFVNPRVQPGRVRWHEDFAAACAAGRTSGKPVLLFQMLGRMDQKFC
jgi:hypothetical protein